MRFKGFPPPPQPKPVSPAPVAAATETPPNPPGWQKRRHEMTELEIIKALRADLGLPPVPAVVERKPWNPLLNPLFSATPRRPPLPTPEQLAAYSRRNAEAARTRSEQSS